MSSARNKLREKYIVNGQINQKSLGVDANTLLYQVPGGMLQHAQAAEGRCKEDKSFLRDALEEIPASVRMPVIRRWSP